MFRQSFSDISIAHAYSDDISLRITSIRQRLRANEREREGLLGMYEHLLQTQREQLSQGLKKIDGTLVLVQQQREDIGTGERWCDNMTEYDSDMVQPSAASACDLPITVPESETYSEVSSDEDITLSSIDFSLSDGASMTSGGWIDYSGWAVVPLDASHAQEVTIIQKRLESGESSSEEIEEDEDRACTARRQVQADVAIEVDRQRQQEMKMSSENRQSDSLVTSKADSHLEQTVAEAPVDTQRVEKHHQQRQSATIHDENLVTLASTIEQGTIDKHCFVVPKGSASLGQEAWNSSQNYPEENGNNILESNLRPPDLERQFSLANSSALPPSTKPQSTTCDSQKIYSDNSHLCGANHCPDDSTEATVGESVGPSGFTADELEGTNTLAHDAASCEEIKTIEPPFQLSETVDLCRALSEPNVEDSSAASSTPDIPSALSGIAPELDAEILEDSSDCNSFLSRTYYSLSDGVCVASESSIDDTNAAVAKLEAEEAPRESIRQETPEITPSDIPPLELAKLRLEMLMRAWLRRGRIYAEGQGEPVIVTELLIAEAEKEVEQLEAEFNALQLPQGRDLGLNENGDRMFSDARQGCEGIALIQERVS